MRLVAGVRRFQLSFAPVGMTTSLISGLPRRDTCTQLTARPCRLTLARRRSAADQTPIVCEAVSTWEIGICSAIVCTA